ncbi:hypothetical protein PG994_015185 [Apiospora phragmitis]|uniref:Aminoglycoside phosphotransferase domain-containing protein n=1 Tax=Apiospora phragmitis TaxID=2905665 RepID=A0ABR1SXZ2_9PEZI
MSSINSETDESISKFFSTAGACTTRSQCDAFASKMFGGPVKPVSSQGLYSYTITVADGTIIIQFREPDSPLDVQMLAKIHGIHPNLTTGCKFHGTIGLPPSLLIYEMNVLPGNNYFDISLSIVDTDLDHRLATVRSLAKFFAQSWQYSVSPDTTYRSRISEDCHSDFTYLSSSLPSRFQDTMGRLRKSLPALFSGEYPLVVTHGDLSEKNILADPKTGEITGIIDWAEASIQPFGFALYALDSILGYLSPNGWVFYDTADELRHEFWLVFYNLVGVLSQTEKHLHEALLVDQLGILKDLMIPVLHGSMMIVSFEFRDTCRSVCFNRPSRDSVNLVNIRGVGFEHDN